MKLRSRGVGVALQDLKDGDRILTVHAMELFPEHNQVYKKNENKGDSFNVKTTTDSGSSMSGKVTKKATIVCKWWNENSNRITPPTIRAGETVNIHQAYNSDQFYWTAGRYEPDVRGQEEAAFSFSNIPRQTDDGKHTEKLDKKKSYYFTISAVKKFIKLFTGDNDKEKYTWDFNIDTKEGWFTILNGIKDLFKMGNYLIFMETKTIHLKAETIILEASKEVQIKSPMLKEEVQVKKTIGNVYENSSTLIQKGMTVFNAHVQCNNNCITTPSIYGHVHTVL